jgi:hypothetical protein
MGRVIQRFCKEERERGGRERERREREREKGNTRQLIFIGLKHINFKVYVTTERNVSHICVIFQNDLS